MSQHAATVDPSTAALQRCLSLTVRHIPLPRLLDSTFWYMLLRMQVYPLHSHAGGGGVELLYGRLLPYLAGGPLQQVIPTIGSTTIYALSVKCFKPIEQHV
jgi:hypothetical protein